MDSYRIYEHIEGLPDWADSICEELEGFFAESDYTADEAERYIKKYVPCIDKYGRKRNVYVYRLTN